MGDPAFAQRAAEDRAAVATPAQPDQIDGPEHPETVRDEIEEDIEEMQTPG